MRVELSPYIQTQETGRSYITEVRELISEILTLFVRISEKNRGQTEELKNNYRRAYTESAALVEKLGSHNLKVAGMTLLCSLWYLSPHASDREIGGLFAKEFVPKFGEMWGSGWQADMRKKDALAQLLIADVSNAAGKSQSDASNKQEFIGILEKLLESLRQAARSN